MRIILGAFAAIALANTAQAEPVPLGDLMDQVEGTEVSFDGRVTSGGTPMRVFISAEDKIYLADTAVGIDALNRIKACDRKAQNCEASGLAVVSWRDESLFLTITSITFLDE